MNTFTITCYGTEVSPPIGETGFRRKGQRGKMTREYETAMRYCDGSEAERYSNIYQDLIAGEKECMDTERPLTPEMEAMLMKMFA